MQFPFYKSKASGQRYSRTTGKTRPWYESRLLAPALALTLIGTTIGLGALGGAEDQPVDRNQNAVYLSGTVIQDQIRDGRYEALVEQGNGNQIWITDRSNRNQEKIDREINTGDKVARYGGTLKKR